MALLCDRLNDIDLMIFLYTADGRNNGHPLFLFSLKNHHWPFHSTSKKHSLNRNAQKFVQQCKFLCANIYLIFFFKSFLQWPWHIGLNMRINVWFQNSCFNLKPRKSIWEYTEPHFSNREMGFVFILTFTTSWNRQRKSIDRCKSRSYTQYVNMLNHFTPPPWILIFFFR